MLVHFDWTTADYEAAFGTTEEEIEGYEANYTFQEHCQCCDEWTVCSGGICPACELLHSDPMEWV